MEDIPPVRRLTLGLASKLHVFKAFDMLLENQRHVIKSTPKYNFEVRDYLKSISVKSKEVDESEKSIVSNIELNNENKKIIKRPKQKRLLMLTDTTNNGKNCSVKYFVSINSAVNSKSKSQNLISWMSKRKFSSIDIVENISICESKKIKLEWKVETEIVFTYPDIFFQSTNSLSIDTKKLTFYVQAQGLNEIELGLNDVKTVHVYKEQAFIKFVMKTSVLSDLKHLSDSMRNQSGRPLRLPLKRGFNVKDIMVIFTKSLITNNDLTVLRTIFGLEKVTFNNKEDEGKDFLLNLFYSAPKYKEFVCNNPCVTWDSLSKSQVHPVTISSTVAQNLSQIHSGKLPATSNKPPNTVNTSPSPFNKSHHFNNSSPINKFQANASSLLVNKSIIPGNVSSLQPKDNTLLTTSNSPCLPLSSLSHPSNTSSFTANTSSLQSCTSFPGGIPSIPVNTFSLAVNSSSLPNNNSQKGVVQLVAPIMNHMPNLVLHPQQSGVSVNNCSNQVINTVLCSPTSFITNYAVIATSMSNNRLDPYPNLFNRMINESTAIRPLAVQVNNFPMSVTSQNNATLSMNNNQNKGLQINDFGSLFQRQNQMNGLNSGLPPIPTPIPIGNHNYNNNSNNNNNHHVSNDSNDESVNKPLVYIPGRHIGNVFKSFNYSPSPEHSVLMFGSDLAHLNYGEYLNDNIINFYLNYIRFEKITQEQRERSHLFNVFFYTKLQRKTGINDTPETRHADVAKWTKKVDIFDKDFIVIPINENNHWFLAIICFPWMAGMISYDEMFGTPNCQISEIPENHSVFSKKTRVERLRFLQTQKKIEPKPCILLFDSLQHVTRAPNVKLIREYLKTEWDVKRAAKDGPLVFDKNTIRGFNPQVPQQTNTIDCGIYVLHYVEMFFEHPLSVYTKEYFQTSLTEWFDKKTVETKREFIQRLILQKAEFQLHLESSRENNLISPKPGYDDSGPDIQIL